MQNTDNDNLYDESYFLGFSENRGKFSLLDLDDKFYDRTHTFVKYYNINSKSHGKIAEIGCGTAPFYRIAKEIDYFKNINIVCTDISNAGIKLLKDKPVFDLAAADQLPYKDSSLLGVIEWDLLEHLEDPNSAIAEAHRVLQEGGYYHIICPNPDSWLRKSNPEKDPYRRDKTHIFPPIVDYKYLQDTLSKYNFDFEVFTRGFDGSSDKAQTGLESMKLAELDSTGSHLIAFAKKRKPD